MGISEGFSEKGSKNSNKLSMSKKANSCRYYRKLCTRVGAGFTICIVVKVTWTIRHISPCRAAGLNYSLHEAAPFVGIKVVVDDYCTPHKANRVLNFQLSSAHSHQSCPVETEILR